MPQYIDKNAGDPWLAADGNALADDIGSPTLGHQHDGTDGHATLLPDVLGDGVGITVDGRILLDKGADISSVGAQLIPLGGGNFFDVTGTTTITSISTLQAGTVLWFQFDAALILTHNATSLILEGGINRTTEAKDIHGFVSLGSGNWQEISRVLQTPSSSHTVLSHSDGADVAKIKVGTYTGDGATSQAITGVGFTVKYLWISRVQTDGGTVNGTELLMTSTTIVDDDAAGGALSFDGAANKFEADHIIALGTDGFTVDDDGGDADPNANTIVYNFIAIGIEV